MGAELNIAIREPGRLELRDSATVLPGKEGHMTCLGRQGAGAAGCTCRDRAIRTDRSVTKLFLKDRDTGSN